MGGGCETGLRPAEAADRVVPGRWDGGLVVGGDGGDRLVTLVERKARYLEMGRLATHETRAVVDLLKSMTAELPDDVRRALLSTLTCGRGADESADGPIGQFFPKGTEFADVTDERAREARGLLNDRPRETLGWKTPAEAVAEVLSKAS